MQHNTRQCHAPLAAALIAGTVALLGAHGAQAEITWHWEDEFSTAQEARLTSWIEETVDAVEAYAAPFAFDLKVHFHRSASSKPVAWANTIRWGGQGVALHVNPEASAQDLRNDWTAYHEFSHLLLPYLGNEHAWFAEGFASYLQYQVMHSAGVIDDGQMRARYRERIDYARRRYDMGDMPFVLAAPKLRAKRRYPTMYWGGAVYFMRVDRKLRASGRSLREVLAAYAQCCRIAADSSQRKLLAELDRLAGAKVFSRELAQFKVRPGFPRVDADHRAQP